jgi:hippurate hydrolase
MPIINRISEFHDDMVAWRHDIHAHPETAFEEVRTAKVVAEKLQSFGIEIHTGLARTGVVGTLKCGDGERVIGLRADMDALDIHELNEFDHRSTNEGKMHGCGHDGHTTMLLGAARYLAETRNFDGTVHFIFQPAEENEAGARVMVEDGLFDLFPCQDVYGMHNMPGFAAGHMVVMPGPMMASADFFKIEIVGTGAHGAMPHQGIDPILVGADAAHSRARHRSDETGGDLDHPVQCRPYHQRYSGNRDAGGHRPRLPSQGAGPDRGGNAADFRRRGAGARRQGEFHL